MRSFNRSITVQSTRICKTVGLLWILGAAACSTTNIQTGGNQFQPYEQDATHRDMRNDPEATFFSEMSRQDPALKDRNDTVADEFKADSLANQDPDQDCQCDLSQRKERELEKDTVAKDKRLERYTDTESSVSDRRITMDQEAVLPSATNTTSTNQNESASDDAHRLSGVASWYGRDFDGRPTASGQIYDSRKLTAAHKTLPLGSIALVRNIENDKEILVTINDRGPYVGDRILDVSEYGAELLGYKEQGLTPVEIKVLRLGKGKKGVTNKRGATYDFFGPDSGYISEGTGAGDDPQANSEIEALLEKNRADNPRYIAPAVQDPRPKNELNKLILPETKQKNLAVQIGIFADSRNALKLKQYLDSSLKWNEPIYVFQRGDKYVVKMGSFQQRSAAETLKGKLILEGFRAFISEVPKT